MKFGSICSGIEAASVAFKQIGWRAAWFSEIEPAPSSLLRHHYPTVPNHGDMTKLPARIAAGEIEIPDALCGGTPCQAFSLAGMRKSLEDARGNLSLTFCEIANELDAKRTENGHPPIVILWENVPGVLSTKDNAFGCFLAGLAGEDLPIEPPGGKWTNAGCIVGPKRTVAWRVTDAQYFGVAQRRRRVFVVASARNGFDPAGVLFEFEGVRRDSAPSREAGEEIAPTIRAGAQNGGRGHGARSGDSKDELIVPVGGFGVTGKVAHTLRGEGFDASEYGTGRGTPIVTVTAMAHGQGNAEISVNRCPTLTCNHEAPIVVGSLCAADSKGTNGQHVADNKLVVFHTNAQPDQMTFDSETTAALTCSQLAGFSRGLQVRRLTPRECERLQGFEDDYTLVPHNGKPMANGNRYKALGNSWAVPNVRWIGERIQQQLDVLDLL